MEKTKIVNLTKHRVTIVSEDGEVKAIYEPDAMAPMRMKSGSVVVKTLDNGVEVIKTFYGEPNFLPNRENNTLYIVSTIVKNIFHDRDDFVVPIGLVKNNGMTIGCKQLNS